MKSGNAGEKPKNSHKNLDRLLIYLIKSKIVTKRLIDAIRKRNYSLIIEIFEKKANYINRYYRDDNKDTLLHIALKVEDQAQSVVERLYDFGCPYDWTNKQGLTPYVCAKSKSPAWKLDNLMQNRKPYRKNSILNKISERSYFYRTKNRIHPGIWFVNNLDLMYGSKKLSKICYIPNSWILMDNVDKLKLTLHDRLKIAEAFALNNASSLDELKEDVSSNNYVTANIGFVVSDKLHEKNGVHKRIFVTIPIIDISHLLRVWPISTDEAKHSEDLLYEYLSKQENLMLILFFLNGIKIVPGHKIYAVILDIYSTRNMCLECESKTFILQSDRLHGRFLVALEKILNQYGYKTPKVFDCTPDVLTPISRKLHMVTRVSSTDNFPRRGNSFDQQQYPYPAFAVEYFDRDIKKFYNSVILHKNNDVDRSDLRNKVEYSGFIKYNQGFFAMYKQTAFVNHNPNRNVNKIERNDTNYWEIKKVTLNL